MKCNENCRAMTKVPSPTPHLITPSTNPPARVLFGPARTLSVQISDIFVYFVQLICQIVEIILTNISAWLSPKSYLFSRSRGVFLIHLTSMFVSVNVLKSPAFPQIGWLQQKILPRQQLFYLSYPGLTQFTGVSVCWDVWRELLETCSVSGTLSVSGRKYPACYTSGW